GPIGLHAADVVLAPYGVRVVEGMAYVAPLRLGDAKVVVVGRRVPVGDIEVPVFARRIAVRRGRRRGAARVDGESPRDTPAGTGATPAADGARTGGHGPAETRQLRRWDLVGMREARAESDGADGGKEAHLRDAAELEQDERSQVRRLAVRQARCVSGPGEGGRGPI